MYTNYAMIFVWSGEEVKLDLNVKKFTISQRFQILTENWLHGGMSPDLMVFQRRIFEIS